MGNKEFVCNECDTEVAEEDTICPNCGGDVTKIEQDPTFSVYKTYPNWKFIIFGIGAVASILCLPLWWWLGYTTIKFKHKPNHLRDARIARLVYVFGWVVFGIIGAVFITPFLIKRYLL